MVTTKKKKKKILLNKIKNFIKNYDLFIKNIENKNKKLNFNNYLLNLWGNIELNSILFFKEITNQYVNLFNNNVINKQNITLLNLIQRNILLNREENFIKEFKKKNYKKQNVKKSIYIDNSIELHICYSIQTEVQVLHNNLLRVFNNNLDIFPHDVIVKSCNINTYIPFIKTIFNSVKKKKLYTFYYNKEENKY